MKILNVTLAPPWMPPERAVYVKRYAHNFHMKLYQKPVLLKCIDHKDWDSLMLGAFYWAYAYDRDGYMIDSPGGLMLIQRYAFRRVSIGEYFYEAIDERH